MAAIYDRFMQESEAACLKAWRAELLVEARGRVLEIGAGTGANLAHYRADQISQLLLTEPDRHMRAKLAERLRGSALAKAAEIVDAPAERLPAADASIDTVVATLVFCSVREPGVAIAEVNRVLAPAGRFIFLEHVASERSGRHLLQRAAEPVWSRLADNCHLTRRTGDLISDSGLAITSLRRESMRKALPIVRATIRGHAVKRELR